MTKRKHRHCSYNNVRLPVDLWVGDAAALVIVMNLTCANKQCCLLPVNAGTKSWCSQSKLALHCGNELWFLSFTLHKKGIYLEEKMEITKCLFITLPCCLVFFPLCFKLLQLQVISKLVSQKMSSHLSWQRKAMKSLLSRRPRNNRLNKYSSSHEGTVRGKLPAWSSFLVSPIVSCEILAERGPDTL